MQVIKLLYNFAACLYIYSFMSNKKKRLEILQELVTNNTLNNQEDLLNLLHKKGFMVTQATLSRDIKQLKIVKSPDENGNYIYTIPYNVSSENTFRANEANELIARGYISLEFSDKLAVLKTRPGYAMGIASDIDNKASSAILGTIAGDDTILLIPREGVSRKQVIEVLSKFVPEIKNEY